MSKVDVELVGGVHDGLRLGVRDGLSSVLEMPEQPGLTAAAYEKGLVDNADLPRVRYRWNGVKHSDGVRRYVLERK